jgi:hypothetical protein
LEVKAKDELTRFKDAEDAYKKQGKYEGIREVTALLESFKTTRQENNNVRPASIEYGDTPFR